MDLNLDDILNIEDDTKQKFNVKDDENEMILKAEKFSGRQKGVKVKSDDDVKNVKVVVNISQKEAKYLDELVLKDRLINSKNCVNDLEDLEGQEATQKSKNGRSTYLRKLFYRELVNTKL